MDTWYVCKRVWGDRLSGRCVRCGGLAVAPQLLKNQVTRNHKASWEGHHVAWAPRSECTGTLRPTQRQRFAEIGTWLVDGGGDRWAQFHFEVITFQLPCLIMYKLHTCPNSFGIGVETLLNHFGTPKWKSENMNFCPPTADMVTFFFPL